MELVYYTDYVYKINEHVLKYLTVNFSVKHNLQT